MFFICIVCSTEEQINMTVCEREGNLDITCNDEKTIVVQSANYGRTVLSHTSCRSGNSETCISRTSMQLIQRECDGKVSCSLLANNTFLVILASISTSILRSPIAVSMKVRHERGSTETENRSQW